MVLDVILDTGLDVFANIVFLLFFVTFALNALDKAFNNQISNFIDRNDKWQPVMGATIGLIPGCSGGIFAFGLYKKGKMKFSGMLSAGISTVGALSFFVLTAQPIIFLIILAIQFPLAILIGYVVQFAKKDHYVVQNEIHEIEKQELKQTNQAYNLINNVILPIFYTLIIVGFSWLAIAVSLVPSGEEWAEEMVVAKWFIFIFFIVITLWYIARFTLRKLNYDINATYSDNKYNKVVDKYFYHSIIEILMIVVLVYLTAMVFKFILKYTDFETIFNEFVSSNANVALLIFITALIGIIPVCGFQVVYASALVLVFGGDAVLNPGDSNFWILFVLLFSQAITTIGDLGIPLFIESRKNFSKLMLVNFATSLVLSYSIYGIAIAAGGI